MHCPFCVKTESFIDPVILRAHYRVKHVDKGIEFAGLKMLRCCDHCDIIGTIKGMKDFKGAHWHCYKCRNGFNRRDEALKHYRTHFRNPMTTFQIQVAQEVHLASQTADQVADNRVMTTETISAEDFVTIHPALTEAVMTSSPADTLAANETVGTTEGSTIMIIQEDPMDTSNSVEGVLSISPVEQSSHVEFESQMSSMEVHCQRLEEEKRKMEQGYYDEISQLRHKIEMQDEEIARLQKREQELLEQLSVPLDERIQELLTSLKSQHEDLLHQQLAQLRRTYIHSTTANSYFVISKPNGELTDYSEHGIVVIPNVSSDASGTVLSDSDSAINNVIEANEITQNELTEAKQNRECETESISGTPAEAEDNLPDNSSPDAEMVTDSHGDIMLGRKVVAAEIVDSTSPPPAKQQKT